MESVLGLASRFGIGTRSIRGNGGCLPGRLAAPDRHGALFAESLGLRHLFLDHRGHGTPATRQVRQLSVISDRGCLERGQITSQGGGDPVGGQPVGGGERSLFVFESADPLRQPLRRLHGASFLGSGGADRGDEVLTFGFEIAPPFTRPHQSSLHAEPSLSSNECDLLQTFRGRLQPCRGRGVPIECRAGLSGCGLQAPQRFAQLRSLGLRRLEPLRRLRSLDLDLLEAIANGTQPLPAEPKPQSPPLRSRLLMTLRRPRLPLQRAHQTVLLGQQVLEAHQVVVGRFEAPNGPVAALAVLDDPGGLLDDGAVLLGAGVEHAVDSALAHENMLVAAHTAVGEELLDVEQPTRRAVYLVLTGAVPIQPTRDGDLGQIQRQAAGAVVESE